MRVVTGLFLLLLSAGRLVAQGQQPEATTPTLQTRSSLVLLDVVVTDHARNAVHDLKASDFRVRDANAPQTIKIFEEHSPANSKPASPLPPMPPGVFTNYTPYPVNGPVNILLIDRLNTPLQAQAAMRAQLVAFLHAMRPGTRLAIFGLSNQLVYLQGFTSEPKLLLAALESKKNGTRPSALLNPPVGNTDDSVAAMAENAGAPADVAANLQQFESQEQSLRTQIRVRYTLDGMSALARYLSGIPGRKNLIWFSGSFPFNILPDGDLPNPFAVAADMQDQFRATTNLLSASQVAVYPIDARGLQSAPMLDASNSGGGRYVRRPGAFAADNSMFLQQTADEQILMQQMAESTGGHAFVNTNDLARAATEAVALGSSYYTIAYTPSDTTYDGRFHKIQVTLDREGLELNYRRGYYADAPNAKPRRQRLTTSNLAPPGPERQTMRTAMLRGAPNSTQILIKTRVTPAGPPTDQALADSNIAPPTTHGPFRPYTVVYAAAPSDLFFKPIEDGRYEAALEFVVLVYDANGAVINSMGQQIHANLDAAALKDLLQTGLQFHQLISVPARGEFFLRMGVHDLNSDKVGVLEIPVAAVANLAVAAPPEPPQPAAPKRVAPSLNAPPN